MASFDQTPGSQKNTADHGGVVNNGNFNGPVVSSTGVGSVTKVTNISVLRTPDQLISALREQLGEARRLLAENQDPRSGADRATAIGEIDSLDRELDGPQAGRDRGNLRQRLNRVLGLLAPFEGIVGGIAAVLDIINNLKSGL